MAEEKKVRYRPSTITKFLGKTDSELLKLDQEIILGREQDEILYKTQLQKYEDDFIKWEKEKELAQKVLNLEEQAIEKVLNEKFSLKSNAFVGKTIDFHVDDDKKVTSNLHVHNIDEIIPSFDLKQLKSGGLSKKEMPTSRRLILYREYVCSAVIRLARETFAILPIQEIIINAKCDQLNNKTGHMEEVIILSAFIPRLTLEKINTQFIQPEIAIENFIHNMNFKKLVGFIGVPQVSL